MSVFEAVMLLCFGAAWPFSIYRSLTSGKTSGKSAPFLFIVLTGYVSGIAHKVLNSRDPVLILYCINAVMVSVDIALYFRNKRLERNEKGSSA